MSQLELSKVLELADRLFPFSLAEPWDNIGLQIGDPYMPVSSVAFGLDATPRTVDFAVSRKCNLLVTHHPITIEAVRTVTTSHMAGRTMLKAASSGLAIVSLHTNFDAAPGGLNDFLADALQLQRPLETISAPCARMGRLAHPLTLEEFASSAMVYLDLPCTRVVGDKDRVVRAVFCVAGSGMSYLNEAIRYKADVIITGDVRYHAARECNEFGLAIVDAGHYGLEKAAPAILADRFSSEFASLGLDLECHLCNMEKDPFWVKDS